MRLLLIPFFAILISINANACVLKGNVFDSTSINGLPFVTIYIVDNNNVSKQVISNEKGYFEIDLNSLNFPIHITFKSIGFKKSAVTIYNCSNLKIRLESSVSVIHQVEINGLSSRTIVTRCLNSMKDNLYKSPFNFDLFFRKTQLDSNGNFIYSTEYVSNVYQELGVNPGITNLKTRLLLSDKKYEIKAKNEGNWEVMFMLSYDLYMYGFKNPKIGIISKNKLGKMNLKYLGEVEIENTKYYKIHYSGDSTNNDFRKGVLIINQNDFGILYFSSELYVNNKLINNREFYYQKIDGKYFLNYIKENSNNPDLSINKKILFVNNYIFDQTYEISNSTKALIKTSLKKDQIQENDSLFWKGFNYIPID